MITRRRSEDWQLANVRWFKRSKYPKWWDNRPQETFRTKIHLINLHCTEIPPFSELWKDFIYKLMEDRKIKIALGPKSEVLSCNPTKCGEKNELMYRIRIFFILEQSVDTPNNYIWRMWRHDSFEFDHGKWYFFKLWFIVEQPYFHRWFWHLLDICPGYSWPLW